MITLPKSKYLRAAALLLIILIGFYLRSIPLSDSLIDPDSYFHYKVAKHILTYGSIPTIDYSSYYPTGRQISGSEPPLLSYAAAYTYALARSFVDMSLMEYAILLPALLWIANCVIFYFLARKFCSEKAALASAALYTFVPAGIVRTHAGHFDKENLALPLLLLYLFLFLRAAEGEERKRNFLLPTASGAALALAGLTWGGFQYFLLLVSLVIIVQMIARKTSESQLLAYAISTPIAIAAAVVLLPLKYSLSSFKFPFLVLLFSLPYMLKLSPKQAKITYFATLIAAATVAFLAGVDKILPLKLNHKEAFVAEELRTRLLSHGSNLALQFFAGEWWIYFQALLFVAPFGLLLCAKEWLSHRKFKDALLAIWAVSSVLAAASMVRLVVLAAPVLSILAARALESAYLKAKETKRKLYYPLIGVIVGLTFFTALYGGYTFAEAQQKGIMYPYWKDALEHAREHTPSDALIIAYWDKGYWIQAIAERKSFADNSNTMSSRNKELVELFCSSDEDEIFRLLSRHSIAAPTYVAVGLDDIPKTLAMRIEGNCSISISSWMFRKDGIAKNEALSYLEKQVIDLPEKRDVYYVEEKGDYYLVHILNYSAPEEKERLLLKLLPFSGIENRGLKQFRLVYNNSGAYVYEVVKPR